MQPHDTILHGDALSMLHTLPDGCVQTCITSPPYWGLRDYGVPDQLGLEATPEEYVARLVAIFREVRRVLRDDGTLWLNLGDSYAANGINGPQRDMSGGFGGRSQGTRGRQGYAKASGAGVSKQVPLGLKPKDLVGIPWRVAFALQADGWYLRSDIVWHKPNCMPESVRDRPTKSHEYVFLLAKSERYYYDADAVREPHTALGRPPGNKSRIYFDRDPHHHNGQKRRPEDAHSFHALGRNKRTVWTVATRPYSGAHFAVMPPALVEPCVLAGTSPKACEHCGAPWQRVVERESKCGAPRGSQPSQFRANLKPPQQSNVSVITHTLGFRPTCHCEHNTGAGKSLVLDPFMGAGTVGVVAKRHNRHYLGIELNAAYIEMAEQRIAAEIQPVLWSTAS